MADVCYARRIEELSDDEVIDQDRLESVAERFDVEPDRVRDATRLMRKNPALFEMVFSGGLKLSSALAEAGIEPTPGYIPD